MLGRGLALLPRDQIVVATKVGRYGGGVFDFRWVSTAALGPYHSSEASLLFPHTHHLTWSLTPTPSHPAPSRSAARVTASVRESLARLQLSYVDLIQCHDIEFAHLDQIVGETLPALAALKAAGLVRHVGITGLPLKIFAQVLDRWER